MASDEIDEELLRKHARPVAYFLTVPGVVEDLELTESQISELKPVILEFQRETESGTTNDCRYPTCVMSANRSSRRSTEPEACKFGNRL